MVGIKCLFDYGIYTPILNDYLISSRTLFIVWCI